MGVGGIEQHRMPGDEVGKPVKIGLGHEMGEDVDHKLIELRARAFHHVRPFRYLGLEEGREFLRRAADNLRAFSRETFFHLGRGQRLDDLAVQTLDNGQGSLYRREESVPLQGFVIRNTRFLERRDVGQGGR